MAKSKVSTVDSTALITTDGKMDYNKLAEIRKQMTDWLEELKKSKEKASPKGLILLDWNSEEVDVSNCSDAKVIGQLAAFVKVKQMAAEAATEEGFDAPTKIAGKTFTEIYDILRERKDVAEADKKIAALEAAISEIERNPFFREVHEVSLMNEKLSAVMKMFQ